MRRFLATVHKELLVLFRDREGIFILFLMPMALIVVMAMIQDAPFREHHERQIPLLLVDRDQEELGELLRDRLDSSSVFQLHEEKETSEEKLLSSLRKGEFKAAVVVPENASDRLDELSKGWARELLGGKEGSSPDSNGIPLTLHFDPLTKPAFRQSMRHLLERFAIEHGGGELLRSMGRTIRPLFPDAEPSRMVDERKSLLRVEERWSRDQEKGMKRLSSVQHNVPAWTVFGIFFIVVTMAGNMIRERNQGSAFRLRSIAGSELPGIGGKVGAYLTINLFQAALMLGVGILFLPLVGLPAFDTGGAPWWIPAVVLAIGIAATGSGVFLGTLFNTHQQATGFGVVAIVLLAALGGIWVPLEVMPEGLRMIGEWSPLHWGVSAFHSIFNRDEGLIGMGGDLINLCLSGSLMMGLAYIIERKRTF